MTHKRLHVNTIAVRRDLLRKPLVHILCRVYVLYKIAIKHTYTDTTGYIPGFTGLLRSPTNRSFTGLTQVPEFSQVGTFPSLARLAPSRV
jgi:hypothetical protein